MGMGHKKQNGISKSIYIHASVMGDARTEARGTERGKQKTSPLDTRPAVGKQDGNSQRMEESTNEREAESEPRREER